MGTARKKEKTEKFEINPLSKIFLKNKKKRRRGGYRQLRCLPRMEPTSRRRPWSENSTPRPDNWSHSPFSRRKRRSDCLILSRQSSAGRSLLTKRKLILRPRRGPCEMETS